MSYSLEEISNWAKYYSECHSFNKVAKKFRVNIKTVNKHLTKNKELLSISLSHEESKKLKEAGVKRCNKCNTTLTLDKFEFNKSNNSHRSECIVCRRNENKKYRDSHKTESAEYQKEYREINADKIKEHDYQRHQNNKQVWNANVKEWYYANWSVIRQTRNERHKERMRDDPKYRIARTLRGRLHTMARKSKLNKKEQHTLDYLGCSIEFFVSYIENKFYQRVETKESMTWDNYGFYGWHIDHIKPLDSFNLFDEEEIKLACHYTNLQPLWSEDNWSKGNR